MNTDHRRDMSVVIPMLSYEDVARAADWITDVFGFHETGRWTDADGRVTHVNMEHRGGVIMLGFPSPDYQSPRHHAENCEHARSWSTTPYVIDGVLVYVSDIDTHFERAQASGATVLSSPEDDRETGQRQYRAEDTRGPPLDVRSTHLTGHSLTSDGCKIEEHPHPDWVYAAGVG